MELESLRNSLDDVIGRYPNKCVGSDAAVITALREVRLAVVYAIEREQKKFYGEAALSGQTEVAAKYLLAAGDAAISWWRDRKPVRMGMAQFVMNPTINCTTEREKRLARAAARWYAIQRFSPPQRNEHDQDR